MLQYGVPDFWVFLILSLMTSLPCLLHAVSFFIYFSCSCSFRLCFLFVESISTNSALDPGSRSTEKRGGGVRKDLVFIPFYWFIFWSAYFCFSVALISCLTNGMNFEKFWVNGTRCVLVCDWVPDLRLCGFVLFGFFGHSWTTLFRLQALATI